MTQKERESRFRELQNQVVKNHLENIKIKDEIASIASEEYRENEDSDLEISAWNLIESINKFSQDLKIEEL